MRPAAASDHLAIALVFFALSYAGAVSLLCWSHVGKAKRIAWRLTLLGVYGSAVVAATLLGASVWLAVAPLAFGALGASIAHRRLAGFTDPGILMMVTFVQLLLIALAWSAGFVATIPVSSLTRGLMLAGYALAVILLPVRLLHSYEGWEVLLRDRWRRPRTTFAGKPRLPYPKVSVHVPVHAEPPEVVIATLDALANLRYPDFEVLVIDNNTNDPQLWRPVEAHCRRLGDRFRFFHVEGLTGAKAGALNLALRYTAADAELVSVVDADYQVRPDFLERLIGYFEDPSMGFVQAPHDYRGWQRRPYLRACYWEYRYFFRTILVSRNERDAAITVGTMCLIRRRALEDAGGWAEWCVTEDSELAIRIHALGYSSVYLTESLGRGLIPETFLGYKRQRFRWTYGPVQELKHHWRLLLPRPFGRPSHLSPAQKAHHLTHGLDRLAIGVEFLLIVLGLGVMASMLAHREVVAVPFALWLTVTVLLLTGVALRWLVYRVVIGCSLTDTLRATIASKALAHTVTMASVQALFTRTMPWRRTDKFRPVPSGLRALGSARTEMFLGFFSAALAIVVISALPRAGLLLMLCIGALLQSLRYFAAPSLALLAERDLRKASAVTERQDSARALQPDLWVMGRRRLRLAKVGLAIAILAVTAGAGVILLARLDSYTHLPSRSNITVGAPGKNTSVPASPALVDQGPTTRADPRTLPVASDISAQPGAVSEVPTGGSGSGGGGSTAGSGEGGGVGGPTAGGGSGGGGSTAGSGEGGGFGGPTGGGGSGGGGSAAGSGEGGGFGTPTGGGGSGGGGSTAGSGEGGGSGNPPAVAPVAQAEVAREERPPGLPMPSGL